MARYIREVELNRPDDFVQYIMTDFLSKHGFRLVEFEGEQVYRAGGGLVEMPKFLSWGYWNGIFHVEAWTRNCWLPGVYGEENAMTGFMGCVPKSAYKKDIEELIGLLYQPLSVNQGMQPGPGMNAGVQPAAGMPGNPAGSGPYGQQPVLVRGTDTSRYATMAFVFALIGVVLAAIVPLIGVLFGGLGITYGSKGKVSTRKGLSTGGFVIGIIAIVISVMVWGLRIALFLL